MQFVKHCIERCPISEVDDIPLHLRGFYTLLKRRKYKGKTKFEVVYVGIAYGPKGAGIHGRIKSHTKKNKDKRLWTHFSVYQVWENVSEQEIVELEGLFRYIYRKDAHANRLNIQKRYGEITKVKVDALHELS